MTKKLLFSTLMLSALLVGCSKNELHEGTQNPGNAILFDASTGKQTRASVVDNTTIQTKSFGVFAYYTGQETWATASATTIPTPNFMNNQEVSYSGGAWNYSPLKYWPNTTDDKVSFFGYWPYDAAVTAAMGELPKISFTQEVSNIKTMTDFIVLTLLDQTKRNDNVVLPFNHVLTRLNFSAKVDRDLSASDATKGITGVFVTGLRILGTADTGAGANASGANAASKFYTNADYTLAKNGVNHTWNYTNSTSVATALDVTPILNLASSTLGGYTSNSIAVNRSGNATSLLKSAEYAFLIPPVGKTGVTAATDVRLQVDYEIVTVDISVAGGYTRTATSATISLPNGSLKESKAYNICMTFGLTDVELDAGITDWEVETPADALSVAAASASNADLKTAWESLNATKAINNNANYFVINVDAATPATADFSATVALYNFENGDQVELKFTSGIPGSITLPIGWSYSNTSKALIVKTSPRGWYLGDLTGAADATDIIILDASDANADLGNLRVLLLGSRTRAVSAGTINLTMLNATGIPTNGFRNCTALKALSLPCAITLGDTAFEGCTNLKGLALSTLKALTTVGADLFGSNVTDLSEINFITGSNTTGVDASAKTWTVGGSTYLFGSVVVSQAATVYIPTSGLAAGQQGWNDGETISIP